MEEMSAICHVVRDQSNKGEKIAEWLRGYQKGDIKPDSESFGVGIRLHLSESAWRIRIRQAWLSGYVERTICPLVMLKGKSKP